jgi:hypothetical protein
MKKKIFLFTTVVLVLTLGFLYINHNNLTAGDDNSKNCSSGIKSSELKAGGDLETYVFVTDKACCDEMKNTLKSELMSIKGVKDVEFAHGCSVSNMTSVKVSFTGGKTSKETIEAFIIENKLDCPDSENCPKSKCEPKSKNKESKNI